MLQPNSLAFRLVVSSALIACALLAIAGFLLNGLFQQAVARNFDGRLEAVMDELVANVTVKPDGTPELATPLADARFDLADSGWYWQVLPPDTIEGEVLLSNSLLKTQINLQSVATTKRDNREIARFFTQDRKDQQLRVIEQGYKLVGATENYSVAVAGNFDELSAEVSAFRRLLYLILGLLGAGLLGAILFQVLYGLKPMKELELKLNDIRSGKVEMLDGNFPSEMQPVADELNLLIQSNMEVVDRARMQVGNLAHALKTPISVLTNEARDHKGQLSDKVLEQVDVMRDQVNMYLDRARRAARAQSIGAVCDVEPVLSALGRTLERIHRDKNLKIAIEAPKDIRFRGERQDLEEMVGNLMDNASKWSKSEVKATARRVIGEEQRPFVEILVDDDGPGLAKEKRAIALKRGQRLDESKPGSGLGLNIVVETAAMYGGRIELDDSPSGGLRAILRLPAVAG